MAMKLYMSPRAASHAGSANVTRDVAQNARSRRL